MSRKSDSYNEISGQSYSSYGTNQRTGFSYVGTNSVKTQSGIYKEINTGKATAKAKTAANITKSLIVLVTATTTGVIGTGAILSGSSGVTAEIAYVSVSDTEVFYEVTLDKYQYDDNITIILYNDFTHREQQVQESKASGYFENLKSNMTYTLEVRKGLNVLAKKKVTTDKVYQIDQEEPYTEPNTSDGPMTTDGS